MGVSIPEIPVRVQRGVKWESVNVFDLSNEELIAFFHSQEKDRIISWLIIFAKIIKEAPWKE